MGNSLAGSMDGRLERASEPRRDERLERASESRRDALRPGGGGCPMMSTCSSMEERRMRSVGVLGDRGEE